MITVADLIAYRRRHDKLVERVVATRLPTTFGDFEAVGYRSLIDDKHHVALVKGEVAGAADVLVRVHSECLTGDVFHSLRCDCGEQLESALSMIEREGQGVLLYLAQEGRGIGLLNKLRAYRLQEDGLDTVEANERARPAGRPARLRDRRADPRRPRADARSASSPTTRRRSAGLEGYGLSVSGQIPIEHAPNEHNEAYLRTKAERMGHTLHHQGLNLDEEMLHAERAEDEASAVAGHPPRRRRGDGAAEREDARCRRATASRSRSRASTRTSPSGCSPGARAAFAEQRPRRGRGVRGAGAFELPLAASYAARSGRFAGVACLGAVIRGETDHYDFVCARGRAGGDGGAAGDRRALRVRRADRAPTMEQALARAGGGKRDQGRHAAEAVHARWRALRARAGETARLLRRCQGVPQLRQGAGVRPQPQPLDGRHQAALRSEPAEGPDHGRLRPAARLRVHALPESRQGHQGRSEARSSARAAHRARGRTCRPREGDRRVAVTDTNLVRFRAAVAGALAHLESRREEVNDLNVFPVADGDTGDNMALTLRAVLDELDRLRRQRRRAHDRRDRPRGDRAARSRARRCSARAATPA